MLKLLFVLFFALSVALSWVVMKVLGWAIGVIAVCVVVALALIIAL